MMRWVLGTLKVSVSLAMLFLTGGCGDGADVNQPPPVAPGTLTAGPGPGPGPGPMGAAGPSAPSKIKEIMGKLTKGPNSLTPVIAKELKQDPIPWETVQNQAREFAQLAGDMGNHEPPKGAKDSWTKLTAEYAKSAAELDKAAKAKDKELALVSHESLANSCMACHRQHRVMGPGMGGGGRGMGMPPGPGGPPPQGPGGPPPASP